MNIYEKLVEVRKSVPYLKKSNTGYQFKYVSSSQALSAARAKIDKLGLLLIPNVLEAHYSELCRRKNEKGNETVELITELKIEYTWLNAENPEEKITVLWYGQGVDTAGEKGVGKALTYAEKYFLLKFFNIATDKDDPDSFKEKLEGKKQSQNLKRQTQSAKPSAPETPSAEYICAECGKSTQKSIALFSQDNYGKILCWECQKKYKKGA